jgi:hypothetical protein
MNGSEKKPACFADLETVFPLREDGLRVTPIHCLQCIHKTPCLRTAIGKASGYRVREEMIDRSYRGGVISFFQRWSQKKSIQRLKKNEYQKDKDPKCRS